jgi:hypothetical protein
VTGALANGALQETFLADGQQSAESVADLVVAFIAIELRTRFPMLDLTLFQMEPLHWQYQSSPSWAESAWKIKSNGTVYPAGVVMIAEAVPPMLM